MIWGLTLQPGHMYPLDVGSDEEIQLSMAALDSHEENIDTKAKYIKILVHTDQDEYLLCTLVHGMILQQSLDLKILPSEKLSFSINGEGVVHITGYTIGIQGEFSHSPENPDEMMYDYTSEQQVGEAEWDEEILHSQAHVMNIPSQITEPMKKSSENMHSAKRSRSAKLEAKSNNQNDIPEEVFQGSTDWIPEETEQVTIADTGPSQLPSTSHDPSNHEMVVLPAPPTDSLDVMRWNQPGCHSQITNSTSGSFTHHPTRNLQKIRTESFISSVRRPSSEYGQQDNADRMPRNSEGKVTCQYCGKDFMSTSNLRTHVRIHTGHKPYVCKHCGKSFAHISNCRRHERIHIQVKSYSCPYCIRKFSQASQRDKHQESHVSKIRCNFCGGQFDTIAVYMSHEEVCPQRVGSVNQPPTVESDVNCRHCGSKFDSFSHYKAHEEICAMKESVELVPEDLNTCCNRCRRTFETVDQCREHEQFCNQAESDITGTGKKCKNCGAEFDTVDGCIIHEKSCPPKEDSETQHSDSGL